jgi:16S rRNA (guanine527-N7)-methyltransferase
VEKGGLFVPYKSGEIDDELKQSEKAVKILAGNISKVEKFELPGTDIKRSFVVIKKTGVTAKKYPRKAGLPSKEPLH